MDYRAIERPAVSEARRVVLKVGTRVLTQSDGRLALTRLYALVEAIAELRERGREVLLVSSGAVGLGRDALGLSRTPAELATRQACAAVGQSRLMELYSDGLDRLGLVAAQVLLTEDDFDNRDRYLNLGQTLHALLKHGAIPVINENDAISTVELAMRAHGGRSVFGDNDRLSALVASELDCDLLVLLTDVDGVFERDPRADPDAQLIACVDDLDGGIAELTGAGSDAGRGGMRSKFEAAQIAARFGCHAVIASGTRLGALGRVIQGESEGTWFPARGSMKARHRWIAFASRVRGVVHVDHGAVDAVVNRNASLLAAGVTGIEGRFVRGDVVEVRDPDGALVARGLIRVDAEHYREWRRGVSEEDLQSHSAVVRSNQLVVMKEFDG